MDNHKELTSDEKDCKVALIMGISGQDKLGFYDWGHAKNYVEAMCLMLQKDNPSNYVIATGEAHSVREFVECAFAYVGIRILWEGKEVVEVGKDAATNIIRVKINPKYFRPSEVDFLLGDSTKARNELGWRPKVTFLELVQDMMEADLELMKRNPVA